MCGVIGVNVTDKNYRVDMVIISNNRVCCVAVRVYVVRLRDP